MRDNIPASYKVEGVSTASDSNSLTLHVSTAAAADSSRQGSSIHVCVHLSRRPAAGVRRGSVGGWDGGIQAQQHELVCMFTHQC
jgi:hypothetical protein